ncbi:MAG TPA: methyltransferase domain-containing protein [Syntrophales bacterium]|nr:methyltransferase domain-containing protein [Syntrophales bacterium]HNS53989.1 methyltransferase domain-containing protein [Syntrophales bacterium]HQL89528.1 methyltransferase domain-containing protein [Syntrophales bacterium]
MSAFAYLSNLLQDRYVASVMPTSRFAVEKICSRVDPHSARTVIEYGPGTGVLTRSLLRRLNPDARLIAIERNEALAAVLRRNCRDPRLQIYRDCAGNVLDIARRCGAGEADCVISGIPFSFLSAGARREILRDTHRILRPGGKFLAYQTFYQPPGHLREPLRELFPSVSTGFAVLSVPPLLLVEAIK